MVRWADERPLILWIEMFAKRFMIEPNDCWHYADLYPAKCPKVRLI
jgi:hypothetical protein